MEKVLDGSSWFSNIGTLDLLHLLLLSSIQIIRKYGVYF